MLCLRSWKEEEKDRKRELATWIAKLVMYASV